MEIKYPENYTFYQLGQFYIPVLQHLTSSLMNNLPVMLQDYFYTFQY